MNYFVKDTARRTRPHHLPRTLPEHSDFHDEHAEMMEPTPEPPANAANPEAGWYDESLST
ncbi:MAG: hypothetical protein DI585_02520 [Pseudomonas fluorescens]|nr:MAG: hypothetical protein DI585_02520 [Pseudomonas fluorescens]